VTDREISRIEDRVDTTELGEGSYTYHVRLDGGEDGPTKDVEAAFDVTSPKDLDGVEVDGGEAGSVGLREAAAKGGLALHGKSTALTSGRMEL
jgi:hypothetical protein